MPRIKKRVTKTVNHKIGYGGSQFGCFSVFVLFVLLIIIGVLVGGESTQKESTKVIPTATQAIEPEKKSDEQPTIPVQTVSPSVTDFERKIFDYVTNLLGKYEEELYAKYPDYTMEQLDETERQAFQDTAAKFGISEQEVRDIWTKVRVDRLRLAESNKPQWEKGRTDIEKMIGDILKGETNTGKKKLREVIVNSSDIENIKYAVQVRFNADDNVFGIQSIKDGIYSDMTNIYKALYTSKYDITMVMMDAYFDAEDKYGNKMEVIVYRTRLYKNEAEKVNWSTDDAHLSLTVLPNVWEVTEDHLD